MRSAVVAACCLLWLACSQQAPSSDVSPPTHRGKPERAHAPTPPPRARIIVPAGWDRDVLAVLTSVLSVADAERVTLHWQASGVIETPWSTAVEAALFGVRDQITLEWVRPNRTHVPRPRQALNRIAADTSNVELIVPGGASGFDLTGQGVVLGEWDQGVPRTSHRELRNRVRVMDGSGPAQHSTAVGGTMIATGIAANARGMSPDATLLAHDWDADLLELYSNGPAAAATNHSYGAILGWDQGEACGDVPSWYGSDGFEDAAFGKYGADAAALDAVIRARDLVVVWAAGNERQDPGLAAGGEHHHWPSCSDTQTDAHASEEGQSFDTLGGQATMKNAIVVGAVRDVAADPIPRRSIIPESYSSFGPMDDGRIKPDLVASGDELYTTAVSADEAYEPVSGTSLAAPVVTGVIGLLAQQYRRTNDERDPRAAEMKALLLQTAIEAGDQPGPDYAMGFGLLDANAAAELLHADGQRDTSTRQLRSDAVSADGEALYVTSDAIEAGTGVRFTLVWHDAAGTPNTAVADDATRALVNDLDLTLIAPDQQTEFHPWSLDGEDPEAAATRDRPNRVDNVERIDVDAAENVWTGRWTLRVSAPSSLSPRNEPQSFGLAGSEPIERANVADLPVLGVTRRIVIEAPFGSTPTPVVLPIRNLGGGSLAWSLSEVVPWLDASLDTGMAPTSPELSFDVSDFSRPGEHIGLIELETNDGAPPQLVTVVLRVTCDAACDGRQCGVDPVCGASCGLCANGRACTAAGTCAVPTAGCPAADLGSQLGVVAQGSTAGRTSTTSGSCGGAGINEVGFRWSAPRAGRYEITTKGSDFDSLLYVRAGTCNGQELACNDDSGDVSSSVGLSLNAGQQIVIWIDGFSDTGPYVLTISELACPMLDLGSTLGTSVVNASLAGTVNDLEASCGGADGEDLSVLWTAPATGQYRFTTAGSDAETDTVLYLRDGSCDGAELGCADAINGMSHATETLNANLMAGQSVVVVIDGRAFGDVGEVHLSISATAATCDGICGGSPDGSCFCDASCLALGDCCTDACSACGHCPCAGDCSGDVCGDDGCGGSCGTCQDGFVCDAGQCVTDACAGVTCEACEACVSGDCVALPDNAPCDDSVACTVMDRCLSGQCAGSVLTCDDRDVCTADACGASGLCEFTALPGCCGTDSACNDGDVCTTDRCDMGTHTCTSTEHSDCCHGSDECNDDNPCTDDACLLGACVFTPGPTCSDAGDAGDDASDGDSGEREDDDAGWASAQPHGGGCACSVPGSIAHPATGSGPRYIWLAACLLGLCARRVRGRSRAAASARRPHRPR